MLYFLHLRPEFVNQQIHLIQDGKHKNNLHVKKKAFSNLIQHNALSHKIDTKIRELIFDCLNK